MARVLAEAEGALGGGAVDFSIDVAARLGISGQLGPAAQEQIGMLLRSASRALREYLLASWPVDTGRSLRAWRNFVRGFTWVVQNPVDYAVHINGGEAVAGVRARVAAEFEAVAGQIRQIATEDIALRGVIPATLPPGAATQRARTRGLGFFGALAQVFGRERTRLRERGR